MTYGHLKRENLDAVDKNPGVSFDVVQEMGVWTVRTGQVSE